MISRKEVFNTFPITGAKLQYLVRKGIVREVRKNRRKKKENKVPCRPGVPKAQVKLKRPDNIYLLHQNYGKYLKLDQNKAVEKSTSISFTAFLPSKSRKKNITLLRLRKRRKQF